MIDWQASATTPDTVKNKDKIVVVCEQCHRQRPQLYVVAKRKPQHICMSCVKKCGEHATGDVVAYTCIDCGEVHMQQYRRNRFTNWRCHHCAMVQGHKDGKFVINHNVPSEAGRKRLSELAQQRWQDPVYRAKWKKARAATKAQRSQKSKELWSDTDRLAALSQTLREVWRRTSYRTIKTEQSQTLWRDPAYIAKQLAGMHQPEVTEAISVASLRHWAENRELMVKIVTENLANPETLEKLRLASIAAWTNPEYRVTISSKVYNNPAVIAKLSAITKSLWTDPDYRKRIEESLLQNRLQMPRISSLQHKLYAMLTELQVKFHEESDATVLKPYAFDCLIPKQGKMHKRLLIECQGDYWHAMTRAQVNDRSKFTFIDRYYPDYEIMYIWESEFTDAPSILGRLKRKLGLEVCSVDFNLVDVDIQPVTSQQVHSFLDAYHYIGNGQSSYAWGAFLNNNLIGCILFSTPLRQNTAGQFGLKHSEVLEISRLCIHPDYHKKNFASWLIAKARHKLHNGIKLLIAYSDATVGHSGAVYKASGFTLDHIVRADYWYISPEEWVIHKRTVYGRAVKAEMTEREFAEANNYLKKFGGPKRCFIRYLT